MSDIAFWEARLASAKLRAVALEIAIEFLTLNPTQSYELDTGQTKQAVTRTNLPNLQKMLDGVLNTVATLEQRISSRPNFFAPAW